MAEFQTDFYPEFERAPEVIIEPDGREVDASRPARGTEFHRIKTEPTTKVGA